jgi:hypothetical protein
MLRKWLLVLGFLILPSLARAQSTTVSGQVTDAGGQSWNSGSVTATFIPNPQYPTFPQYTWTGGVLNSTIPGTINGTGGYSLSLPSNTSITPVNSMWQLQFCPAATSSCFTIANITVTGATQTLNATPPVILIPAGASTTAYADTEVIGTAIGQQYYNITSGTIKVCQVLPCASNWVSLGAGGTVTSVTATGPIVSTGGATPVISCPTCSTSSSTVPINQVVSATGVITPIALGNNPLEWDCALTINPNCFIIAETTATPSSIFNPHMLLITTLTGSAASGLAISPGANGPSGTNAPELFFVGGQAGGLAGASQNGFTGSGIGMFVGDGSPGGATTGNGGSGGVWALGGGNGGAAGGASANNGGNGGTVNWGIGNGGNASATGNGGAAGSFNIPQSGTGTGGNGGATSGTGGSGGDFNLNTGMGGNAAVGSTTGRGGNFTVNLGRAGSTGTPGAPGKVLINRGQGPAGSTTTPLLDIVDVWNTSGVVDALIRANVTADTSSGTGSLLLDLQHVGSSVFTADKAGNVVAHGTVTMDGSSSGSAAIGVPAAAGSPCVILLPSTSPTVGQFLSSAAPSGGNCVTSWSTVSTGTIAIPATVSGATSGGIPCFDSTTDMNTTAAITVNDAITGGGAAACAKDSGIPVYTGARAGVASNTAVGVGALASNAAATDTSDTAFGNAALNGVNGSGGSNTAMGQSAGTRISSGSNNSMFGTAACNNTTTGTQQVCLGSNTQPNAAGDTNEIVIGFNFSGAGSNTATIGNASVTDVHNGGAADAAAVHAKAYDTASNCSSSASPAVCGSAAAGSAALPTNAVSSSIVVNTTAVTANSQIFVQTDDTLGTKLSVTCNSTIATLVGGLTISARTPGTSFTIANNVAVVTNPLCVSYLIIN